MQFHRILPLAVLTASLALTPHARAQPPAQAAPAPKAAAKPAPKPPPPPKPDGKATRVLDEAIKSLDVKKLGWAEATLWQQFDLQGLKVQTRGSYLAGPDYHLHVRLKVDLAGTVGTLEHTCDGTTLWKTWEVRRDKVLGKPEVHRLDWQKVMDALNRRGMPPHVRDVIVQQESFAGMAGLLQSLREGMTVTGQQETRWDGHAVVKLTAAWTAQTIKAAGLGSPPWPYLPDRCELYLDRASGWPYRLEWWGKVPSRTEHVLLVQMEFRDPKFHKNLSRERRAREFTFHPGAADVIDETSQTVRGLEGYAEHKVK